MPSIGKPFVLAKRTKLTKLAINKLELTKLAINRLELGNLAISRVLRKNASIESPIGEILLSKNIIYIIPLVNTTNNRT